MDCDRIRGRVSAGIDKVHIESLCRILRAKTEEVELASHATEHGKLVMRVRLVHSGADVKQYIKDAAAVRLQELRALLATFLTQPCTHAATP